ncbi:hypothetical protein [Pollutimonas bauzanensis]|uniref:MaoC-like domain-containing protein n=1 Tax=Pollutimonas bauzanensis TaxID=658167 RepID=A0A1M5WZ93_9BURK|nr:hypothetical protein [Pollutimonas bauzanensis]SHH92841.1 hypothetical protein SAMN04488135_10656 [Pollutimonas bauzanensis]
MFSEHKPTTHNVVAKVVARPEFVGTLHDDDMARSLGYPAALVPGIDIYAYLARLALQTWGSDWLFKGVLSSTSLRPVYHGDDLVVYAGPIEHKDGEKSVEMAVHNANGAMVASARAALSDSVDEAPDPAGYPILPRPADIPPGDPQALRTGMRFSSSAETVSASANARQVKEFLEPSSFYEQEGIVHPAYLQRLALKNAHASFAHATPPIFISTEGRHFGPARTGEKLDTPGAITRLWERKGHHYMESEQLVLANGKRPVMLIRRVTIYQARQEVSAPAPAAGGAVAGSGNPEGRP